MVTKQRVRRTATEVLDQDGSMSLDDPSLPLQYAVASGFLTEFAAGHDHAAVMRELVQNEYDAEGHRLHVTFGRSQLIVEGVGNVIDAAGWQRLSVMIGTGQVAGSDRSIEQKVNGIGSKNFGLRSLFLYGDRIKIYSGGSKTVLDLTRGTLPQPLPDPNSRRRRGVRVEVPYRTARRDILQRFGPDQEELALTSLANDLAPILLKLAQPEAAKSLRELVITSDDTGRRIVWKQSVREIVRRKGVSVVERHIRVSDSAAPPRRVMEELEFQKVCAIPQEYREQQIPSYFRLPGGRIRISLSLRLRKGRIELHTPGLFYYPIGISTAYTGTAISVCAPFQMDVDRSQMHNPANGTWNAWLLDKAAEFTVQLLTSDWLDRFGADAFRALHHPTPPVPSRYHDSLNDRLRSTECWPSRARIGGNPNRPRLVQASNLVISDSAAFDGLLSDVHYLDDRLTRHEDVRNLALNCGAKRFTVNSLVRLRCAGRDATRFATKPGAGEANYYFDPFPDALKDTERQLKFAQAFDEVRDHLTAPHRKDLSTTPTTLTAAGTLDVPTNLWVVDPRLGNVTSLFASIQLHPILARSKVIAGLCKKFNVSEWLLDTARKIQAGSASSEAREAVYRYLISPERRVSVATLRKLRAVPVLRDSSGAWVAPSSITLQAVSGAEELAAVLHAPHPDYAGDLKLAQDLGFRQRIGEQDIIAYARLVSKHPELAEAFEETLKRFPRLLTKRVIEALHAILFLRSSRGDLAPPSVLYIRTPDLRACVGDDGAFAFGPRKALYRHLGCLESPKSFDILQHLARLREHGAKPTRPEVLYPRLVEALVAERITPTTYRDQPILWNGQGYSAPSEVLLTCQYRDTFLESAPQVEPENAKVLQAYRDLGAMDTPHSHHWRELLLWFGQRSQLAHRALSARERHALLKAYGKLDNLPPDMPDDVAFLLDDRGRLHSRMEALTGRFLIDDDQAMAQAAVAQGARLAFADFGSGDKLRLHRFYRMADVRSLTDVRQQLGVRSGSEMPPPSWFNSTKVSPAKMLAFLHSSTFLSAAETLAARMMRRGASAATSEGGGAVPIARLRALARITFVADLQIEYRVGGAQVTVPSRVALDQGVIYLAAGVDSRSQVYGLLAQAVAGIFAEVPAEQHGLADALFRLIAGRSLRDIRSYLVNERGIPWTVPTSLSDVETAEADEESDEATDGLPPATEQVLAKIAESSAGRIQQYDTGDTASHRVVHPQRHDDEKLAAPSDVAPLPPIPSITVRELTPVERWAPPESHVRTGGGGSGSWSPPSVLRNPQRDAEVGRRGEEIIYQKELERVRSFGYPDSAVIWVSDQENPMADYDIQSVDAEGSILYIEVKSTTGKGGHFYWPQAEFDKALRERAHYVLCRVYEANTDHPTFRRFEDPIGLYLRGGMVLDIEKLYGEVTPLEPS
jgi:Domain of unknown function (DUF3883)